MKKKIGIVTLHGYFNYGNRLQNFALKYTLEKMGFLVDTVVIQDNSFGNKFRAIKNNPKLIQTIIKNKVSVNRRTKSTYQEEISKVRKNEFKEYSNLYLSEKFYNLNNENQELMEYSYFVTGSDQVWNPINYDMLPIYFLTFTDRKKRIAYAPSISVDELPRKLINEYQQWFLGMKHISVREEAGANIIRKLINRDVPVVADPTLLLSKKEWLQFSKRASSRTDKPYILTYFLGGPPESIRNELKEMAENNNMSIINLGDINDSESYRTGPNEFIDYINNASAFFTDSFHGVVFSIILQTPFIVYERQTVGPTMYSRIETILEKFNLKNREANGFNEDVFIMDFSNTIEVLKREQQKSISYLNRAFRIGE